MAEKIVNNSIEFMYSSNNAVGDLQRVLEKYFLYQKVLFIDEKFEYRESIKLLQNNVKCNIIVCKSICEIKDLETFACVVNVNNHGLDFTKSLCEKYKIPYSIVLTKVISYSNFIPKYRVDFAETKNCFLPMGIILDKQKVNKNIFLVDFFLETSSVCYELLEDKINSLFFNSKSGTKKLNDYLAQFKNLLVEKNVDNSFNEVCELYMFLCLKKSESDYSVLDNLSYLLQKNNQNLPTIKVKFIYKTLLLSLEKNYFLYYTNNFKDAVNHEKHVCKLKTFGITDYAYKNSIEENRFSFLLNEFRKKFLIDVEKEIEFTKILKYKIGELNLDELYKIHNLSKNLDFKTFLSLEPDVFHDNSFLQLLNNCGLLNYTL